jgi:DNA-binding LacI/PurR family transcriptional regulator
MTAEGKMTVTLKDIAEEVGVSPATVSLAIRGRKAGKKSLSPGTVEAVLKAAKKLGYRPNMLAKNLASQSSMTIGVLLSSLVFGSESFLEGVNMVLGGEFTSLLSVYNRDAALERAEMEVLIGNRVAGIVAACSGDPENLQIYKDVSQTYNIPIVLYSRRMPGIKLPVVRADHFESTFKATRALQELGHKRIRYAGISFSKWIETHKLYVEGYEAAMRDAGLENEMRGAVKLGVKDWVKAPNVIAEAANILDTWAADRERATALLVDNDWLAYQVLDECRRRGIRVPQDLSLMSIGDYRFSALSFVDLSTMRVKGEHPMEMMVGIGTAELLRDLMAGGKWDGNDILLPVEPCMRTTTGRV